MNQESDLDTESDVPSNAEDSSESFWRNDTLKWYAAAIMVLAVASCTATSGSFRAKYGSQEVVAKYQADVDRERIQADLKLATLRLNLEGKTCGQQ